MGKIIIVTFLFMGYALYELSGGADFVPIAEEKRLALAAQAEQEDTQVAQADPVVATPLETVAQTSTAAPVTAPAASAQTDAVLITASASADVIPATTTLNAEPVSFTDTLQAAIDEAKVEALTQPAASAAVVEQAPADIREVSATRVNMRNGPGRSFSVVAKLNAGDRVEILQDPGDGWVKLQVEGTGRIGWMADFLLTASNN